MSCCHLGCYVARMMTSRSTVGSCFARNYRRSLGRPPRSSWISNYCRSAECCCWHEEASCLWVATGIRSTIDVDADDGWVAVQSRDQHRGFVLTLRVGEIIKMLLLKKNSSVCWRLQSFAENFLIAPRAWINRTGKSNLDMEFLVMKVKQSPRLLHHVQRFSFSAELDGEQIIFI